MSSAGHANAQIRQVFSDVLSVHVPSDDTDLIDGGFLDSLALVELLFELEVRLGVSVPLDTLEIDDLRTISRIAGVVTGGAATER